MTDETAGPPSGAGPRPFPPPPTSEDAVDGGPDLPGPERLVPLKSWSRLPMGEVTRHGRRVQIAQDGPDPMIILTRRNGSRFGLNDDLVERVDETPDTVVLLVTGSRYIVQESLDEVVDIMRRARSAVLGSVDDDDTAVPGARPTAGRAALRAIRGMED